MNILDEDGEVVVRLVDGWTLRSGAQELTSGEYVRLVDPSGVEYAYWDNAEWAADPILVMGAIMNSAAGLRVELKEVCECIHTCADDPATACSLSGEFHTHPGEPCPVHPDAPTS